MIFIIDFDGTLAIKDTVDALLQRFAPATWEAVESEAANSVYYFFSVRFVHSVVK